MFPGHHPTPRQSPRQQLQPRGGPCWHIQSMGLCSLPSSSSQLKAPGGGWAPELHSPTDDLLVLSPDEVLLLRRQDAQGEFLPCPALPVHHVRALVHVDGALREGRGL